MKEDIWWPEPSSSEEVSDSKVEELNNSLRNAVVTLSKTDDGCTFLRWLIDESGALKSAYPRDAAFAAWHEGRRALGLNIVKLCTATDTLPALLKGIDNE